MSKQDVADVPAAPPRKRRQLEVVPDLWLAVWLDSEELTPSEQRRVAEEKARRKRLKATAQHRLGLIVTEHGLTPVQLEATIKAIAASGATEVHHGGVTSKLHNAAREIGVVRHTEPGWRYSAQRDQEIIRECDAIIACPKELTTQPYATPGVWSAIGYARHRGLPVTIISPAGELL